MSNVRKAWLSLVVLADFLAVGWALRRHSLPRAVETLGRPGRVRLRPLDPSHAGMIVHRVLRIGDRRPRCLISSLVLHRLLSRQGIASEVVIGLPERPTGHQAHAWVEVERQVVGPPPGRAGHAELARYGAAVGADR